MDFSVIIVNYKVKHFLDQCLHTVLKASVECNAEIIVVDNNSCDGSVQLVQEKFPSVQLIENTENVGFSRANNQALKCAKGKYILLLNPDTVVEEDTFTKVIAFMDKTPDAGALGVKMIDGKGNFLPESKRGLPTPWVAFYKIFGLSSLFPQSKKFGKYHLSYLNKNKIHEVDVLAGAFMLLRKSVLDEVGILDEAFFMYGEDIDLSYRIQKSGLKNYYYPETTIIHYKGESTKKGSLNYVKLFYKAMLIFAKKHFTADKAEMFTFCIHIAIFFRASLSFSKRVLEEVLLPIIDGFLIWFGFKTLAPIWGKFHFQNENYYPEEFYNYVVPIYVLVFVLSGLFTRAYKTPISIRKIIRGILCGVATILVLYALTDEQFRFSRALILMGAGWAALSFTAYRYILSMLKIPGFSLFSKKIHKIAVVGNIDEAQRVRKFLSKTQVKTEVVGFVSLNNDEQNKIYIGNIQQVEELIDLHTIDELIFCSNDISSAVIIECMRSLKGLNVDFKIAPPESLSIIGSNSSNTAGDLYTVRIDSSDKNKKGIFKQILEKLKGNE